MKIRKLVSFGCALLMAMELTGGLFTAKANETADVPAYTDDAFKPYYADNGKELLLQDTSLTVAVKDTATGEIWYSNPQDLTDGQSYGNTVMEQLRSQVLLQYYDRSNQLLTMNSFKHCVSLSQYTIEKLPQGVQVSMVLGAMSSRMVLPQQLRAETFERVLAHYESDTAVTRRLKFFYFCISMEDYEDSASKKEALSKYPLLSKTDIYVLKSVTAAQREELNQLFRGAGMTVADVEEEHTYLRYESKETTLPSFELTIRYELIDGALKVSVPVEEIRYDTGSYYLSKVTLLPFFGAAVNGEEGSLLLPDGCGTMIPFSPKEGSAKRQYLKGRVYGRDISVNSDDANTKQFSLPLYGVLEANKAFLAILTAGEDGATITAEMGGFSHHYNTAYGEFTYLNQEALIANTQQTKSQILFEKQPGAAMYAIEYHFLTGDKATVGEMAATYRAHLGLTQRPMDTDELPLYLTALGALNVPAQFLGIPYTKTVALTTLSEAGEMLNDLKNADITRGVLNLKGFTNGGLNGYAPAHSHLNGRWAARHS